MTWDKLITIGIYYTIFISSMTLFSSPFEFHYGYIVMLALFPFFVLKHGLPLRLFLVFVPLLLAGFTNIYIGLNTVPLFLKVFLGVFLSTLFYYYVARTYDLNVDKMFKFYMQGAVIIAGIGLIQFISELLGFSPGYDFRWLLNRWSFSQEDGLGLLRLNSIFGEPSSYGMVMAPATFFAIYNLIKNQTLYVTKLQSWLLLITYLLTFSTISYVGIVLMLILMMVNYGLFRYFAMVVPILIVLIYMGYHSVPGFEKRFNSTYELYMEGNINYLTLDGSSVTNYNNLMVALENFRRYPLFGTGLGSHPVAFNKYSLTKHITVFGYTSNSADANSMFSRLMSETGLMGLGFMGFFIFKFFVRRKEDDPDDLRWLISAAMLCIIFLYLIRQGHYFLNGFPFFMWLYYYNSRLPFGLRRNAEE